MTHAADQAELSAALTEIVAAMAGSAAMLTTHGMRGGPPDIQAIAGATIPAAQRDAALAMAATLAALPEQGGPAWSASPAHFGGMALLLPIDRIEGLNHSIISIFYLATPSVAQRQAAETCFAERRPLAIGYFRRWQLGTVYRRRCETLEAALNLTDIGILMIDRTKRIAFANDAGEAILAHGDGLRRLDRGIGAVNLQESICLQVALDHLAALQATDHPEHTESATILTVRRKAGPPLVVAMLAPASPPRDAGDVAAILFIVVPELDTMKMIEPVCRLYLLSPVETRLVTHLAQGRTLGSASGLMGIKEQTARSYMKQIFLKTATNRQSELIVLILSSIVRLRKGMLQRPLTHAALSGSRHAATW